MSKIRKLYPIPEARELLGGIGHSTIYRLVNEGHITKVNIGRRGFITAESIEAYIETLSGEN